MKDNLSYLLSALEFATNVEAGDKSLECCENEILKQQPKWQSYLEQQANLLEEAIKVFKNYDKANELKYFWQMLKTKNVQFNEGIFKQLIQIALQAYDKGTLDDAYKMFSFITTYYPKHYKSYLYLGSIVQSLHGADEAAAFFKTTTSIFAEPDLLFLAAENEIQRENTAGARDYLQKAMDVLSERQGLDEYEAGLKGRIEELLKLLKS